MSTQRVGKVRCLRMDCAIPSMLNGATTILAVYTNYPPSLQAFAISLFPGVKQLCETGIQAPNQVSKYSSHGDLQLKCVCSS